MTRMDPEDARQGKKGTPVLKVLIAALVLCAIVAVGLTFYARSLPPAAMPAAGNGNTAGSSSAPASTDATTTPTPTAPAPAN